MNGISTSCSRPNVEPKLEPSASKPSGGEAFDVRFILLGSTAWCKDREVMPVPTARPDNRPDWWFAKQWSIESEGWVSRYLHLKHGLRLGELVDWLKENQPWLLK